MNEFFHSVVLDKSKCKGCTTCLRYCPTQAIRIRNGKAMIIQEKCIDCGECIRVCPHHAKNAITDNIDSIKDYKYTVAIPAPTVIGQFKPTVSINKILTAIKSLGFNEVVEVAYGAEFVGDALKMELEKNNYPNPIISSACPAVVRLIQVRFPELIPHIIRLESPMEVTARITMSRLIKKYGFEEHEIGIFFITPCAAKATTINNDTPWDRVKSCVSGSISIKDIYPEILERVKTIKEENLQIASGKGLIWADSGGEANFLTEENVINVDGIHNVISVIEEIERDKLNDIDYFEGLACIGGCVGGCLTVENSFISKKRIANRFNDKNMPSHVDIEKVKEYYNKGILSKTEEILPRPMPPLDNDLSKSIEKMTKIDQIEKTLPGLDCGSCGAPGCRALAEDIVRNHASEVDCIFVLKEAINELSKIMYDLSEKVVPVMNKEEGEETNED